jgi:hypothetical protein
MLEEFKYMQEKVKSGGWGRFWRVVSGFAGSALVVYTISHLPINHPEDRLACFGFLIVPLLFAFLGFVQLYDYVYSAWNHDIWGTVLLDLMVGWVKPIVLVAIITTLAALQVKYSPFELDEAWRQGKAEEYSYSTLHTVFELFRAWVSEMAMVVGIFAILGLIFLIPYSINSTFESQDTWHLWVFNLAFFLWGMSLYMSHYDPTGTVKLDWLEWIGM